MAAFTSMPWSVEEVGLFYAVIGSRGDDQVTVFETPWCSDEDAANARLAAAAPQLLEATRAALAEIDGLIGAFPFSARLRAVRVQLMAGIAAAERAS